MNANHESHSRGASASAQSTAGRPGGAAVGAVPPLVTVVAIEETRPAACDQCGRQMKCVQFLIRGNDKTRSGLCWEHFLRAVDLLLRAGAVTPAGGSGRPFGDDEGRTQPVRTSGWTECKSHDRTHVRGTGTSDSEQQGERP